MLSLGEIVVLGGAALFLLGRKEGVRMLKRSGNTLNKFWKQVNKDGIKDAEVAKKTVKKKTQQKD